MPTNEPIFGSLIFSDVDETLIRTKSLFDFVRWGLENGELLNEQHAAALDELRDMRRRGVDRVELNRLYYAKVLSGLEVAAVRSAAARWFGSVASRSEFYKREVVRVVDGLRARGAKLVLVTGSFSELVEPIARELFAHHAITAPLERQGGVFTGRLLASPTIGPGKAQAVERYAREAGVPLARCFALGDDVSDIPFLELAG